MSQCNDVEPQEMRRWSETENLKADLHHLTCEAKQRQPHSPSKNSTTSSATSHGSAGKACKEDQGTREQLKELQEILCARLTAIELKLDEFRWQSKDSTFAHTVHVPQERVQIPAGDVAAVEDEDGPDSKTSTGAHSPANQHVLLHSNSSDTLPSSKESIEIEYGSHSIRRRSLSTSSSSEHTASIRQRICNFLDDPLSSTAASWYQRIMFVFTLLSCGIPVLQTLNPPPLSRNVGFAVEASIDMVFIVEVLIRFCVCRHGHCKFVKNVSNLLHMANIPIIVLRALVFGLLEPSNDESVAQTVLVCIVPVLRMVKALTAFPSMRLLWHAFSIARVALTVPLFMLLAMVLVFSTALYAVEPRSNIQTIPHAIYLVVITLSTVGYGDISPETDLGRFICSIIAMCGVLYMAMPITIVGDAFTHTWKDRGRIILIGRTRERLVEWGFTDTDLGTLFKWFDRDGSGTIDIEEFSYMISKMRLGLSQSSIEQLFNVFDKDVSGEIDLIEFKKSMRLPTVGELTHVGQLTLHSDVEDDQ